MLSEFVSSEGSQLSCVWMDDPLFNYFISDIIMQNMDKISYKHIRRVLTKVSRGSTGA